MSRIARFIPTGALIFMAAFVLGLSGLTDSIPVYAQTGPPSSGGGGNVTLAADNTFTGANTFNGVASLAGGASLGGNSGLAAGGNFQFSYGSLNTIGGFQAPTALTPDGVFIGTGTTPNSIQFGEQADAGFDFQNACTTGLGVAACTDPTFIIHSHNQNTAQSLSFAHNAANAVIYSGLGPVALAGVASAVASAAAMPLPTGNIFHVTGVTNITSITSTGLSAGLIITIIFDGILTFTDGNNLKLAGNFVTTADDTITLAYDGTNFFEIARAVN